MLNYQRVISDSQPFLELDTGHDDISWYIPTRVPQGPNHLWDAGCQPWDPQRIQSLKMHCCESAGHQLFHIFEWTQRWTMMNLQNAQLPANSPQKNTHNICRISDLPVETRRVAKYSWAKSLGHIGDLMNWQWKAWFSIEQVIYLSI